jgi:hypothetical protein
MPVGKNPSAAYRIATMRQCQRVAARRVVFVPFQFFGHALLANKYGSAYCFQQWFAIVPTHQTNGKRLSHT